MKLHLALDHDGYLPCFAVLTDGRRHEVKVAHELHFAPGTIVIMDRGYNDYALYARWTREGVYFGRTLKGTLKGTLPFISLKYKNVKGDATLYFVKVLG